jgi:hypothetical protein
VNDLIAELKWQEVHGHGVPSRVVHPLTVSEFEKQLEILRRSTDLQSSVYFPCISLYQYHLIGRSDDVCNFTLGAPRAHPVFDFAFDTEVSWSKNVREEHQCPPQICLGANDPNICLHIALATHLETFLDAHPDATYLFTPRQPEEIPDNSTQPAVSSLKSRYYQRLRRIWNEDEFKALRREGDAGNVGTHSNRKFPSTFAAHMGARKDQVEI